MSPKFRDASQSQRLTEPRSVLVDSITAHALLNLADSVKDEERRFRAILRADEVVLKMDAILAELPSEDAQRPFIEKARFELAARLDQTINAAPCAESAGFL